jgi:hypothetical protein
MILINHVGLVLFMDSTDLLPSILPVLSTGLLMSDWLVFCHHTPLKDAIGTIISARLRPILRSCIWNWSILILV